MSPKKLTPKRQAFVTAYLRDGNATQAAIAAGYSAKTAKSTGSRMLTFADVQEAVGARLEKVGITAERVLEELGKIAFVSLSLEDRAKASDDNLELLLSVRVPDKLKALELLGKHLKLFTDKVEHTGKDGEAILFEQAPDVSALSLDDLKQLRELVAKTQRGDAGRGDSSSESH